MNYEDLPSEEDIVDGMGLVFISLAFVACAYSESIFGVLWCAFLGVVRVGEMRHRAKCRAERKAARLKWVAEQAERRRTE